jgi:hypothetical protein
VNVFLPHNFNAVNKITVEVTNLNDRGFGIDGLLTRREWRQLCLAKFLAGHEVFNNWQHTFRHQNTFQLPPVNFDISVIDNETSQNRRLGWSGHPSNFIIDLTNQEFDSELLLSGYVFYYGVMFSGSKFKALASFDNTVFHEDAYFIATTITSGVFTGATFHKGALFDDSIFGSNFSTYARFNAVASFKRVQFSSFALFQGAHFNWASFDNATFIGNADFSGNTTNNNHDLQRFGPMSFAGSVFNGKADFSNRIFEGATNFGKQNGLSTEFHIVPLFHNCELHQDTTFESAKFPEPSAQDETDVRAYNTLRLAMSKNQHLLAEKTFSRYVLESERVLAGGSDYWFFTVYKFVSNYGYSIWKPLLILILTPALIAAIIYGLIDSSKENCLLWSEGCSIDLTLFKNSFLFSTVQILPLGMDRTSELLMNEYFPLSKSQYSFITLVLLQKILALIGWFLVGLAIRNLFKIK